MNSVGILVVMLMGSGIDLEKGSIRYYRCVYCDLCFFRVADRLEMKLDKAHRKTNGLLKNLNGEIAEASEYVRKLLGTFPSACFNSNTQNREGTLAGKSDGRVGKEIKATIV